jgi:nitroreductase
MENLAALDHPVHSLIERRWSPYAFADKPVDPSDIASLLEAARWAPSSFNEQPWRFIIATRDKPEDFKRLLDCLAPANQEWAGKVPVLMLSVASLSFAKNGKPNRHALHDVGLASATLALQATDMGLAVHFMAGFDSDKARDTFAIPEEFEPVAAIAVGHRLVEPTLDSPSARQRRPVDAFAYAGAWNSAAI